MPVKPFVGRSHAALITLLGLGSAICVALVVGRILYGHNHHFQTLIWNLFLAWAPLVLAAVIYRMAARRGELTRWIVAPVAVVWLLFLFVYCATYLLSRRADGPA